MVFGSGDHKYELIEDWAKLPEGWTFGDVGGLAVDGQDRLYVLNRGGHPVIIFDRDGKFLRSWGEGLFDRPHGVCIAPDGSVWTTDDGNHTVCRFTPEGQLLSVLGTKNQPSDTGYVRHADLATSLATIQRGGPPFNRPTGVFVTPEGIIYVTDGYGNARVHKFAPNGRLLRSWGEPGNGPGQFCLPHAVLVDEDQRVWVCDRENSRIQVFDGDGALLDVWFDVGGKPTDLYFAPDGTTFVSIKSKGKPHGLSIFDPTRQVLARWGETEARDALFWTPHAIAVDSRGDIYIGEIRHEMAKVDRGSRALQKFVRVR